MPPLRLRNECMEVARSAFGDVGTALTLTTWGAFKVLSAHAFSYCASESMQPPWPERI